MLTNMYPSPERPSFGIFVAEQVEDLRRAGIDVELLSFDGTRDRRAYLRAARDLRDRLRMEHFDLVHAHYGLTGAIAVSQRQVPAVTTFHGGDYTGQVRWHTPVSWAVARLGAAIVVSAEGLTRLRRSAATVVPMGVDTERFAPMARPDARRALGWPERPHALLLGSRALRNKRADLFDAAVAMVRQSRPELETAALEGLQRADVGNALNAADVAVICSDTEGSPVVVREALACVTPVVGVDVGDVPHVLAGLPGCAVVRRDPAAIAEAILAALATERRSELRSRAEETARPVIVDRLVSHYRRMLSGEA